MNLGQEVRPVKKRRQDIKQFMHTSSCLFQKVSTGNTQQLDLFNDSTQSKAFD